MRALRGIADAVPLPELADVVESAARAAGFDDLIAAAVAVRADPDRPQALYDFGYACIERGVAYLAVPALRLGLRRAPGANAILIELVAALEEEGRHADAVAVLEEHPDRRCCVIRSVGGLLRSSLASVRSRRRVR